MDTELGCNAKYNPELVDLMFGLMFEILWLPPHDRRRETPDFQEFDRRARYLVGQLCTTNLTTASGGAQQRLWQSAESLAATLEPLLQSRIIPHAAYLRAVDRVRVLAERLETALVPAPEL